MAREIAGVITPHLGLRRTIAEWETIARHLADPPRRRKRASLS